MEVGCISVANANVFYSPALSISHMVAANLHPDLQPTKPHASQVTQKEIA